MMTIKKTLLLSLPVLSSAFFSPAFAQTNSTMILSNTSCKIYSLDSKTKHWNTSSDTSSFQQTLSVKPFKNNFYSWKSGSTIFAADSSCFTATATPAATGTHVVIPRSASDPAPLPAAALSNATAGTAAGNKRARKKIPYLKGIHIGFLSWGETPSLQSSSQNYNLVYRSYTWMLGVSTQWYRTPSTSLEAEVAFVHGTAEVNEISGNTPSPINYVSKSTSVNGLQLSPGIYYNGNADWSENGIGFVIPILYRHSTYDNPGAGYSITGTSKLLIGAAVVGRLDKDSFLIEPRYGFTQSLTNWYLAFCLGKTF
jgi:hypothetical protein